ncbi:hypothetical protein ACQ4M3_19170 [Leptolyngbya sp. AN03gr2]|uniref:hypothetical protein n=1 Tax=Leptolyngbya sp. AN03gr2 TaxID=3423364 RepID=UPI003D30FB60
MRTQNLLNVGLAGLALCITVGSVNQLARAAGSSAAAAAEIQAQINPEEVCPKREGLRAVRVVYHSDGTKVCYYQPVTAQVDGGSVVLTIPRPRVPGDPGERVSKGTTPGLPPAPQVSSTFDPIPSPPPRRTGGSGTRLPENPFVILAHRGSGRFETQNDGQGQRRA